MSERAMQTEQAALYNIQMTKKRAIGLASDSLNQMMGDNTFSWHLKKLPPQQGRHLYGIPDMFDLKLYDRELQRQLRKRLSRRTPGRESIIRSLYGALNRATPYTVLRTDIKSFYDQVPHRKLIRALAGDSALDGKSQKLIERLLKEYSDLTGLDRGIPQGFGASAYLAEYYLGSLDRHVATLDVVKYYARYVDDIVVVCETPDALAITEAEIDSSLMILGLRQNAAKRKVVTITKNSQQSMATPLTFLGYSFQLDGALNKPLGIRLSARRVQRYKWRIDRAFLDWQKQRAKPKCDPTSADGLLFRRLKFLTGNTRLTGRKSSALIGSYFSNRELDILPSPPLDLEELDEHLISAISMVSHLLTPKVLTKVSELGFVSGFENRTFHLYSYSEIEQIVACWKGAQ